MTQINHKVHAQVWRLSGPIILSNLSVPLLGMVDTAVMGHLPDTRFLAGVAIGNTIIHFLFWAFGFLRMSTVGLAAHAHGANNAVDLQRWLIRGFMLAVLLGALLIIFQYPLLKSGLWLMAAPENASDQASIYMSIRIWGAPAVMLNYVVWGWFLGREDATTPLIIMVFMNALNILLDLVFVYCLSWETAGVAWATLIAEYSGLLMGMYWVNKRFQFLPEGFAHIADLNSWKAFAHMNSNLFIRTVSMLFAFAFFTAQSGQLGEATLALNAVLLNFQMFAAYGLDAIAFAAEALVGKAIGSRSREKLMRVFRVTMFWSALMAIVFSLVYWVTAQHIVYLLTSLDAIRLASKDYLIWVIITPMVSVWAFWLDGVFIGASRSVAQRNAMLVSVFLIYLPTWYVLRPLENHGLWFALMVFLAARGITLGWRFWQLTRHDQWLEHVASPQKG